MFSMRRVIGLCTTGLLLSTAQQAFAGDDCSYDAQLALSTSVNQYNNLNIAAGANKLVTSSSGYSSGTVDYHCGFLNLQASLEGNRDFPYTVNNGTNIESFSGAWGAGNAKVFWRDPSQYAIGVGLRRSFSGTHIDRNTAGTIEKFDIYSNYWDGSAFGEIYASDTFTMGMTGTLSQGETVDGDLTYGYRGADITAFGRYYLTPNLRVGLGVGTGVDTWDYPDYTEFNHSVRGNLNAAYKFEDTPFQIYGKLGADRNNHTYDDGSDPSANSNLYGTVGFTIDIGANAEKSLIVTERNGVW